MTNNFIWAGGLLMAQIGSDGNTIAWSYDQSGKMLGFALNNVPYFYLRNLQNDVIGIYDSAGNMVVNYSYGAWGNLETITGPLAATLGVLNPIRYKGYYYDTETGYYYCQSRYYNPEWCRWISADVYMDTQCGIMGTNMYAYCQNDPVNLCDPTGFAPVPLSVLNSPTFMISDLTKTNKVLLNEVNYIAPGKTNGVLGEGIKAFAWEAVPSLLETGGGAFVRSASQSRKIFVAAGDYGIEAMKNVPVTGAAKSVASVVKGIPGFATVLGLGIDVLDDSLKYDDWDLATAIGVDVASAGASVGAGLGISALMGTAAVSAIIPGPGWVLAATIVLGTGAAVGISYASKAIKKKLIGY